MKIVTFENLMAKHSIFLSFQFAFKGLRTACRERNFVLHLVSTGLVVLLSAVLGITLSEWAVILVCTGGVLCLEIMNTAIEKLVDLVSPEYNQLAGTIKDLSAAAVLVGSIVSAAVGLIIFLPYIF